MLVQQQQQQQAMTILLGISRWARQLHGAERGISCLLSAGNGMNFTAGPSKPYLGKVQGVHSLTA